MSSPGPHPCKIPCFITLGVFLFLVLVMALCTIGSESLRQNPQVRPSADPTTASLPTTHMGVPVSPYPYNPEYPPDEWTLVIVTPDRPDTVDGLLVKFTSPHYEDIKVKLPMPRDVSGGRIYYEVSPIFFDALVEEFFGEIPEELVESGRRWEKREYHWANVEAFNQRVQSISADRVIDQEEAADICFLVDTWEAQLTEAIVYVRDFRSVEPEFVNEPLNGLLALEEQAIKGLTLLEEVECVPGVN